MNADHYAEKPKRGREWRIGAVVYEENRCSCLSLADAAEERGEGEKAADLRGAAERWRKRRDDEQRRVLDAEFKRQTFRKPW